MWWHGFCEPNFVEFNPGSLQSELIVSTATEISLNISIAQTLLPSSPATLGAPSNFWTKEPNSTDPISRSPVIPGCKKPVFCQMIFRVVYIVSTLTRPGLHICSHRQALQSPSMHRFNLFYNKDSKA